MQGGIFYSFEKRSNEIRSNEIRIRRELPVLSLCHQFSGDSDMYYVTQWGQILYEIATKYNKKYP